MIETLAYEQALELVRRLDRPTRARFVAQVVQELAVEPGDAGQRVTDPRATLAEIRAHFAQQGPVNPSAGEQLDRDRQHRADLLEGRIRE
ncbi:hypothetical protein [Candidatus Chloroploca sp. Khr17]|uniref:hypothetical protein n=1 Tax=Candidatus Chloroploca sp. Khr17 TaxID=2496869 RepID=UPI00101C1E12|nr:hypothetical protein [Candidatus Chloroploca sp. Khr17]